jgi:hypothetical protein
MYEDVPESARIGLYYTLEKFWEHIDKSDLYSKICVAFRIPRETRDYNLSLYYNRIEFPIEQLIMSCDWWGFYDLCELIYQYLYSEYRPWGEQFSELLNSLFVDEQLGFEIRNGKVEKVGSGFVDAKIKEARYLLKEPEFKGADEQFEKAIKALNARPEPDVENSVKDAVGAIEAVGRIIVNDEKALLSDIVKDMVGKGIIPKPLDQTIQKLYAYRGDQPGVAHGAVGASKVTIDEAEFVLAMSAAMIIYLVKKGKNT